MTNDNKFLTSRQVKDLKIAKAHGSAHVVSVGISNYDEPTIYGPIKQCSDDAIGVANAFRDIHQLNANQEKILTLTSKHDKPPTKNAIIGAIRKLANDAAENDRIIFFFSGHGEKFANQANRFFLVPQDAYAAEAESLIDFDEVKDHLNRSRAKQKLIILDACFSGPGIKKIKARHDDIFSRSFLEKYLTESQGVAIIASSEDDQISTAKSPNPNYSLFTHFLLQALSGESGALGVGSLLTVDSLYNYVNLEVVRTSTSYGKTQRPVLAQSSNGLLMLADFTLSIAPPDSIDLGESNARAISFDDKSKMPLKNLTSFKFKEWSKKDFVQDKVNEALSERYSDELGEIAAKIANVIGARSDTVIPEDCRIAFPGGEYLIQYEVNRTEVLEPGHLVHTVTLNKEWFERPDQIPNLIRAAEIYPKEMTLTFKTEKDPRGFEAGLKARGWTIANIQTHEISFKNGSFGLTIRRNSITFTGLAPSQIFGHETEKEAVGIAGGAMALLFKGR